MNGLKSPGTGRRVGLIGIGGLLALLAITIAGCINVYVQPTPTIETATQPTGRTVPYPNPTPEPFPTPVSSFAFTSTDYWNSAWSSSSSSEFSLGTERYLVTMTVLDTSSQWEWCGISGDWSDDSQYAWLKVVNKPGATVHSASAVLHYTESTNALDRVLNNVTRRWTRFFLASGGNCERTAWEVRGVKLPTASPAAGMP